MKKLITMALAITALFGWTPEPGLRTLADHYIYVTNPGYPVFSRSILDNYIH